MNTSFKVNAKVQELPITGFTLNNIYSSLVQNLYGSIEDTVLPSIGNPQSAHSDFAPWMDGDTWKVFDPDIHGYKPTKAVLSNVVLSANPTSNRLQELQNKDGTWALLSDAYNMRPVITLQEGLVSVDWDIGSSFQVTLSGNRQTAFYMQHSRSGMEIELLVTNSGTNQTVGTWDSAIVWPTGSAPIIPASTPGAAKSSLITFRNINGIIYGEFNSYEHQPITNLTLARAVPSVKTGGIPQHD